MQEQQDPLDEQVGFESKHQNTGVRKCIALPGMVAGFEDTSKQLRELTGVSVSGKVTWFAQLDTSSKVAYNIYV